MLKRIYTLLFSSALIALQSVYAAPNSVSNIKKIIKKDGKVIVIVRENGKDKEIILDQNMLNKITSNKKKDLKNNNKIVKKRTKDKKISKKKTNKKIVQKSKIKKSKGIKSNKPLNYTVKSGDTIFSIARKYKVSISSLVKINKLTNSKVIHPGDILKIPSEGYLEAAKKAVKNNKKTVYVVKKGDTLSGIAKAYNMKLSQLKALNNFKPNPKIKPGMEINVIGKAKTIQARKKATKYTVKKGDTLWSIARKHSLTVAQLKLLNPKIRTKGLRKGIILNVSKARAIKLAKLRKKRKSRLSGLLKKYQTSNRSRGGNQKIVAYAKRFLGVRYRWGATGNGGFDCSGFTQFVMRHAKGRAIPRVSRRQAYYGRYVSRRNLRPGDLIFFDTSRSRRGYVNHVGIYIGNGRFIHASSGKHRVVITSLNKPFYRSRFMWGRRIN